MESLLEVSRDSNGSLRVTFDGVTEFVKSCDGSDPILLRMSNKMITNRIYESLMNIIEICTNPRSDGESEAIEMILNIKQSNTAPFSNSANGITTFQANSESEENCPSHCCDPNIPQDTINMNTQIPSNYYFLQKYSQPCPQNDTCNTLYGNKNTGYLDFIFRRILDCLLYQTKFATNFGQTNCQNMEETETEPETNINEQEDMDTTKTETETNIDEQKDMDTTKTELETNINEQKDMDTTKTETETNINEQEDMDTTKTETETNINEQKDMDTTKTETETNINEQKDMDKTKTETDTDTDYSDYEQDSLFKESS